MTARRTPRPKRRAALVWERPEPPSRPAPGPLSRERIVRAAVALADKAGLEAVSLRNVGAALDVGPMRLYRYVSTKDELLALMVDAVFGEIAAAGHIRGDWRKALRTLAQRLRRASSEHRWLVELLGGHPHLGPNALAVTEASLAAVAASRGFEKIDDVMHALRTVMAYVIGAVRDEANELRSGMDERQWQKETRAYVERVIAGGRFPALARVYAEATHPPHEALFERGLDTVLDGIAARLSR